MAQRSLAVRHVERKGTKREEPERETSEGEVTARARVRVEQSGGDSVGRVKSASCYSRVQGHLRLYHEREDALRPRCSVSGRIFLGGETGGDHWSRCGGFRGGRMCLAPAAYLPITTFARSIG